MIRAVLIRPGATLYDEQQRIQGSLDVPLSERGRAEATRLAVRMSDAKLDALYSAPCASAMETAATLGRALRLRVRKVEELRNLDHGLWQGLRLDEVKQRHLRLYRQWQDEPRCVCPPCGEALDDALDRVRAALRGITRRHRDGRIGLVAPDPIAQLIASCLRPDGQIHLDERGPTGELEWIDVEPVAAVAGLLA